MRLNSPIVKWIKKLISPELSGKYLKHKKVTLHPNSFLDNRIVLFYERQEHTLVNNYLSSNYSRINKALAEKGMQFIYLPKSRSSFSEELYKELSAYVAYKYPDLFSNSRQDIAEVLKKILSEVDITLLYQCIGEVLEIPSDCTPCLIHSIDYEKKDQPNRRWEYSIFYLNTESKSTLRRQIRFYLSKTGIPSNNIFFSVRRRDKTHYDADEYFQADGNNISSEIKQAINALKTITNEKVLVASLLHLFRDLKNKNPEVCQKLSNTLFQRLNTDSVVLSKIIIDDRYRIRLPDYNQLEIELTPLPKAFYIFMLRHPEGIRFKDLSNHRDELIDIYKVISNRYDMDQIRKSIYDLTDVRSNSVNEKCARIKEAFLSKFDETLARNYFITGGRNNLKNITIDRSLVHLPKIF